MSLKIRRGTNTERLQITPAEGELIYTTDTKNLYIGDGTTVGGTLTNGIGYTGSSGSTGLLGGTLTSDLNISNNRITNGTNLTINGSIGSIISNSITSPNLQNVTNLSFGTNALLSGNTVNSTVAHFNYVNTNNTFTSPWVNFFSVQNNPSSQGLNFTKARGTIFSPTSVQNGDQISSISATGYTGSYVIMGIISAHVDGDIVGNIAPGKWSFQVLNSQGEMTEPMTVNSKQITHNVPLTVPVYENETVRDTAINSPASGMLIMVGNNFHGYNGSSWVQLNN